MRQQKILVRAVNGKVIGTIEGTTFKKVIRSKDFVRKYGGAISLEAQALEKIILPLCGLTGIIEVTVKDTKTIYRIGIKDFLRHGILDDLGTGDHYFVPKEYWQVTLPAQRFLPIGEVA
jgi:hypothetical protein